jgi:5-methyltetrahydrofolate--homocysteine methyltransferase
MFILLPLDSKEVPLTFKERKKIIKKIFKKAKALGFRNEDIVVDGLAMAISCSSSAALETLKTIDWCAKTLKCNTVIGLSNISFGLPQRKILNATFLKMARAKGLTLAIADPLHNILQRNKLAENVLLNKDKGCLKFIACYSKSQQINFKQKRKQTLNYKQLIFNAILDGNREDINELIGQAVNSGADAFMLIQEVIIPAIIRVGELFDKKEYFLPQLIVSAEAMEKGLSYLRPHLKKDELVKGQKATVVIATVKGDIHDIGKNIVVLMLKNYGFKVIDLGKDVSARNIILEAKHSGAAIVGLSALMTTTMVQMKEVINLAKKEALNCHFMIGGAVLNQTYAESIGAAYAKDGIGAVRLAEKLWKVSLKSK